MVNPTEPDGDAEAQDSTDESEPEGFPVRWLVGVDPADGLNTWVHDGDGRIRRTRPGTAADSRYARFDVWRLVHHSES